MVRRRGRQSRPVSGTAVRAASCGGAIPGRRCDAEQGRFTGKGWSTRSAVWLLAIWWSCTPRPAEAHFPHDEIQFIELSPEYEKDQTVYIEVLRRLYKSTDGGQHWKHLFRGLDYVDSATSLAVSGSAKKILYVAAGNDGIFKSRDEGESWSKANGGLGGHNMRLLAVRPDSALVAFCSSGDRHLFRTIDGGEQWDSAVETSSDITTIVTSENGAMVAVGTSAGELIVSVDGGETWESRASLPGRSQISSIVLVSETHGTSCFVGTLGAGIFKSTDDCRTLVPKNEGLEAREVISLSVSPDFKKDTTLFASTWRAGVFRSRDGGEHWSPASEGLTKDPQADEIAHPHFSWIRMTRGYPDKSTLFLAGFDGLFVSRDEAEWWTQYWTAGTKLITSLRFSPAYARDGSLALTTYVNGMYFSSDKGESWHWRQKELLPRRLFDVIFVPKYPEDPRIFTADWFRFMSSTNGGESWDLEQIDGYEPRVEFHGGRYVIAMSPEFDVDQTIFLGTIRGEIFKSEDAGARFSRVAELRQSVRNILFSSNYARNRTMYAATQNTFAMNSGGGVYRSVDAGESWTSTSGEIDFSKQHALVELAIAGQPTTGDTLLAATEAGLFKSADGGGNWANVEAGDLKPGSYLEAIGVSPDYGKDRTYLLSVRGQGFLRTMDDGLHFTAVGRELPYLVCNINNPTASPISFSPAYAMDRTIVAYAEEVILRSTDRGETWRVLRPFSRTRPTANWATWLQQGLVSCLSVLLLAFVGRRLKRFRAARRNR